MQARPSERSPVAICSLRYALRLEFLVRVSAELESTVACQLLVPCLIGASSRPGLRRTRTTPLGSAEDWIATRHA